MALQSRITCLETQYIPSMESLNTAALTLLIPRASKATCFFANKSLYAHAVGLYGLSFKNPMGDRSRI